MDGMDLLMEFAEYMDIDKGEVEEFINSKKYDNPTTLEELLKVPDSMLNHIDYISYLDDPLKSFIRDEMWCERYMTIELDDVVDILADRMYDANRLGKTEKVKELEEVEKHIIDIKFGSVVYDW